jgi:hypothetical protein
MGEAPQWIVVNGQRAHRDLAAEHGCTKSGDPWVNHESLALMVHPLDVKKCRAEAHDQGLNVTVRDDGMEHFDSRIDQKKYCRAYGYTNYDDTW